MTVRLCTFTMLWEKLIKIGAKVTWHSDYVTFQLAEVAVPRELFAVILERIKRLEMLVTQIVRGGGSLLLGSIR